MVVSHWSTETVFDYSFKQVVVAYWNRYPNPSSTHVLTEDTIKREIRDGKLYSRRLLSKTNPVPKWGARFYNNAPVKIIEDSILDPVQKTLTTFTRNIGMKKIMKVDEIVVYREQRDGRTVALRSAYISSHVFGFSRAIRAFGIERFKMNSHRATNGFNYVLRKMFPQPLVMTENMPALTKSNTLENASNSNNNNCNTNNNAIASANSNAVKVDVSLGNNSETFKKAAKTSYEFIKCHASKIAQLFSIRN